MKNVENTSLSIRANFAIAKIKLKFDDADANHHLMQDVLLDAYHYAYSEFFQGNATLPIMFEGEQKLINWWFDGITQAKKDDFDRRYGFNCNNY